MSAERKTPEQIAREVVGADALAGVGYDKYLPYMIAAIEADRAQRMPGLETITVENTGVTYEPETFDGGIGYRLTHPDGRQEFAYLRPSGWHDGNEAGSQADTFLYVADAQTVADFDAENSIEMGVPATYVNHFERERGA